MAANWELTREMFLSLEEVDGLLDFIRTACRRTEGRAHASAVLDRLIIESLLFSGLRTTEFCRLNVEDTVVKSTDSVFVVTGLGARDRSVYLPRSVSDLVLEFVEQIRSMFLPNDVAPNDPAHPLVFSERKNPYERSGLYRRVVRVLTAAGLGDRASVQLLRHTYGYLAYVRTGGNLLFVQRQLGHAHPMVTSIYAQFVDERYDKIVECICDSSAPRGPTRSTHKKMRR